MKSAVLVHGGGPTAVMNASLAGVYEEARSSQRIGRLFGARYGVVGLVEGEFYDLLAQPAELMDTIAQTPGSALGSTRRRLLPEEYERAIHELRRRDVHIVLYTGGNGSMQGAASLASAAGDCKYDLQVIGIPKTIDNDLSGTDHTPGFPSAARFAAFFARDAGEDNRSLPSPIMVLEVLGRDAGWVAGATALARHGEDDPPHLVYFPERPVSADRLFADVEAVYRRLGRCVVAVCEGQRDDQGECFGADMLPDTDLAANLGHTLAQLITTRLKVRARAEKPGLLGRSCAALASPVDREEAHMCGRAAVKAAIAGESGKMVAIRRESETPYRSATGLASFSELTHRTVPLEWISEDDITPEFRRFLEPLVGSVPPHPRLMR
jgi:6-phosphofructokinase 1